MTDGKALFNFKKSNKHTGDDESFGFYAHYKKIPLVKESKNGNRLFSVTVLFDDCEYLHKYFSDIEQGDIVDMVIEGMGSDTIYELELVDINNRMADKKNFNFNFKVIAYPNGF